MKLINCPLCGLRDERILLTGKDRLLGIEGEFTLVQCRSCGLIYLNPQPTLATLASYYPEDKYPGHSHKNLKEIASGKTLRDRFLRRLYLLSRYQRIREVDRLQSLDEKTRFLDVGCGNGGFLYALRAIKGVKGIGVELSQKTAVFSQTQLGLDVRSGAFLESHFSDESFDLVTMFQYFEHETQPLLVLQKTKKILKKKGLLVIELPNVESPMFKTFKSYWFHLDLPRHVFHYSSKTLAKMLKRSGFEIISVTYHPTASVVTSLMHLLGVTKRLLGPSQAPFLLSFLFLHFPLQFVEQVFGFGLSVFRASDIMTIYARRKK